MSQEKTGDRVWFIFADDEYIGRIFAATWSRARTQALYHFAAQLEGKSLVAVTGVIQSTINTMLEEE